MDKLESSSAHERNVIPPFVSDAARLLRENEESSQMLSHCGYILAMHRHYGGPKSSCLYEQLELVFLGEQEPSSA